MITEISLDFGPFYQTAVPVGPLTVVTSDAPDRGKSHLVVRSLEWCLFNNGYYHDDDAKDEIRHIAADGTKAPHARVRVTFDNGTWVERFRSKQENRYTLFDGTTEQTYTSFGAGYFDKVGDLTGIRPVTLDGKNAECPNIHGYHDPVFLLSRSPAQIDAILSRLLGGDTIEDAGALVSGDLRKTKQAHTVTQEQLVSTESALEGFGDLDRGFGLLDAAKRLQSDCEASSREISTLERLSQEITKRTATETVLGSLVERAAALVERTGSVLDKLSGAQGQLVLMERSHTILKQIQGIESETSGMHLRCTVAAALIGQAEALQVQSKSTLEMGKAMKLAARKVTEAQEMLSTAEDAVSKLSVDVETAEDQFQAALRDAGVCPLCGQATSELCLEDCGVAAE